MAGFLDVLVLFVGRLFRSRRHSSCMFWGGVVLVWKGLTGDRSALGCIFWAGV